MANMTKEEAGKLYDSLKKAMENRYGKDGLASLIAKGQANKPSLQVENRANLNNGGVVNHVSNLRKNEQKTFIKRGARGTIIGQRNAILAVVCIGLLKLTVSFMAFSGLIEGGNVEATMNTPLPVVNVPTFSDDELIILKSLDERRVTLEERGRKLEKKEEELEKKDREFAARLTQLKELSAQLKIEREKGEKKHSSQLNQLASVYSSMGPKEAAQLLEQLDISISLSLIERMPEKRMAQILALMTPKKALTLTQMLSKRGML